MVHGGQQPVSGTKLYLYAAGTSGYGTGSTSLLPSPGYVTTDSAGRFSISGQYTCPSADSLLYLIARGGNPGLSDGTDNNSIAMMVALGSCSYFTGSSYTLDPNSFVILNEETTIAGVYSLAQFMAPESDSIGTSSTNLVGLQNAFATAMNIVSPSTGIAGRTTVNGVGTLPQATINSLADILATCINSSNGSNACSTLYANATPPGGSAPTDTLGAALDIALNPGNNVSALNTLVSSTAPFQPTTVNSSTPNDWTLMVSYAPVPSTNSATVSYATIDGGGNVWYCTGAGQFGSVYVQQLSPLGAPLTAQFSSPGYTGNLRFCEGIVLDQTGNIWVGAYSQYANAVNGLVSFSPTGTASPASGVYGSTGVSATTYVPGAMGSITIGPDNKIWVPSYSQSAYGIGALAFDTSGNALLPYQLSAHAPALIMVDDTGTLWGAAYSTSNFYTGIANAYFGVLNPSSAAVYSQLPYTCNTTGFGVLVPDGNSGAWLSCYDQASVVHASTSGQYTSYPWPARYGPASGAGIDGAKRLWFGGGNGVLLLGTDGTALSGGNGFGPSTSYGTSDLQLDGSGNAWATRTNGVLWQFIGVAAPVVTPHIKALQTHMLGQHP
ncbi:MAG: hypothetical protein PW792_01680 [Acidobacteriaceae bacterium]|nr:hypothetical protein [Acidobacteriaceae bacterium]